MLKIYLSGAISNKDIKQAKKEFAEAEKQLKKEIKYLFNENEMEIINPFKILKVNKKYSYKDYLLENREA